MYNTSYKMVEISKCFELMSVYAYELETKQRYPYISIKIHTI